MNDEELMKECDKLLLYFRGKNMAPLDALIILTKVTNRMIVIGKEHGFPE